MILIYHSWASVLIDSGASHSFLAFSFASALGLEMEVFDPPLIVESPIGGHIPLSYICRQCEMTIEDRHFTFDFIVLDMAGFDLILGMDWLSSHHAIIDCYRRRVLIRDADGEYFYFHRDRREPLTFIFFDPTKSSYIHCFLAS